MTSQEKEFIDIIKRERHRITRICANYSSEKMTRDDLFQEVMYNLWKGFESFRGESTRETWIFRVTLYTCMQHYRKVMRNAKALESYIPENDPNDAEMTDSIRDLHKAVRSLDESDRAIMILYLEDRSYAEISSIMGISQSNTGVRISRARQKIKKIMKSYGNR